MTTTASPSPRRRSRRPGNAAQPCSTCYITILLPPPSPRISIRRATDAPAAGAGGAGGAAADRSVTVTVPVNRGRFVRLFPRLQPPPPPVSFTTAAHQHYPRFGCEFRSEIVFHKDHKKGRVSSPAAQVSCEVLPPVCRKGWGGQERVVVLVVGGITSSCCCCRRLFAGKVTDN